MEGHRGIKAIAISSDSEEPISPCGICRQFISEFGPQAPVYMFLNTGTMFQKAYMNDLLPKAFGPANLGIDPMTYGL